MLASLSYTVVDAWAVSSPYTIQATVRTDSPLGNSNLGVFDDFYGDDKIAPVNLPFPVKFYGRSFDYIEVSTNGVLSFGTGTLVEDGKALPVAGLSPSIFGAWNSMVMLASKGHGIMTNVSGSAPDRTFTVRWKGARWALGSTVGDPIDFEVRLHESSSNFEILQFQQDSNGKLSTVGAQLNDDEYISYPSRTSGLTATTQLNFIYPEGQTISVSDATVAEGDSGSVKAKFVISLLNESSSRVTVNCATADGTATANEDYQPIPLSTVTFAPGETRKTIWVSVKGDKVDEDDETFSLNLSSPSSGVVLAASGGVGTIKDDDSTTVLILGSTVLEGNSGTVPMTVQFRLSTPSSRTVTVKPSTVAASMTSATSPADYAAITGGTTLTFAPGETSKSISINVNGDTLDEDDEYVGFSATVINAELGTIKEGKIVDDDAPPVLSINDVALQEGGGHAVFTVSLSAASGRTVTVKYSTEDGSAQAGNDYVAIPLSTLVFAPGQTTNTVVVILKSDSIDEVDENYYVRLSAPVGATFGDNSGTGTIIDDDTSQVSATGLTVNEGDTGSTQLYFIVRLSVRSSRPVTVRFQTTNSATYPASNPRDYTGIPITTIYFDPGETAKSIAVSVNGDRMDEEDEHVGVVLSAPVNAVLGSTTDGIIKDDDDPPSLSISDVSVAEGDDNSRTVSLVAQLSAMSGRTVSVVYSSADGTASAGSDYLAVGPTTMVLPPGAMSGSMTFTIYGDTTDEGDEEFKVNFSNQVNVNLPRSQATVTIKNDDKSNQPPVAPQLSLPYYYTSQDEYFIRTVDLVALASDPDGDPLTLKSCQLISSSEDSVQVSVVGNKLQFSGYTALGDSVRYTDIGYTVSDGLASSSNILRVSFIKSYSGNRPPVAVDDIIDIGLVPDGSTTSYPIDVLANDYDPDGDPIRFEYVDGSAYDWIDVSSFTSVNLVFKDVTFLSPGEHTLVLVYYINSPPPEGGSGTGRIYVKFRVQHETAPASLKGSKTAADAPARSDSVPKSQPQTVPTPSSTPEPEPSQSAQPPTSEATEPPSQATS